MTVRSLASGVVLATLLASSAQAIDPPAKYRARYRGDLHISYVSAQRLKEVCAPFGSELGCAFRRETECEVFLPKWGEEVRYLGRKVSVDEKFQHGILGHELGHCNGWAADHSG